MVITIKRVEAVGRTVGHVDVGPAVAIKIDDRHGRAHRSNLRHDVLKLRVENRCAVDEINPGLL